MMTKDQIQAEVLAAKDGGVTVIGNKTVARENGYFWVEGRKRQVTWNQLVEILCRSRATA